MAQVHASAQTIGIDACKGGWVAVALRGGRFLGAATDSSLQPLVSRYSEAVAIGVDIPIGLPRRASRPCDEEARIFVGVRRRSVFATPPAQVLAAPTHGKATLLSVELTGKGLSQQSYALRSKIREGASLVASDRRIFEVHPEVSFRALAGRELAWSKKTWAGHSIRRKLLAAAGIELPDDLGPASSVASDDVLDSAAAAWSATRYALGHAQSLPDDALGGQKMVIWY